MRYLRYALLGVGGLLAALIAIVALTFDPNRLKPEIVALVKEQKQRTLTIDGDIKLSLFPNIGASIGKLTLSEHQSDQVFLSLDQARVSMQLWPLLKQRYIIDGIEAEGVTATIRRNTDGSLNIDDLLKKEEKKSPLELEIDHIRLARSNLSFDDRQQQRVTSLKSIELKTGAVNQKRIDKLDLAAELDNSKPAVKAKLTLQGSVEMDADQQQYGLAGLKVGLQGDVDKLKALLLTLEGNARLDLKAARYDVDGLALSLESQLERDKLVVKLGAPKLALSKQSMQGDAVDLNVSFKGDKRDVAAELKLSGLAGSSERVTAQAMALAVDAKEGADSVKLKLASPVDLTIQGLHVLLPQLKLSADVASSKLKSQQLGVTLAGSAEASANSAKLVLAGRLDTSNIKASAAIDSFAKPFYRFNVSLDQLDLNRYLADAPAAPEAAPGSASAAGWDLSGLKSLNAEGHASIGSIRFKDFTLTDFALELKAGNGQIQLSPLTLKLFDGQLQGSATASTTTQPRFTLSPRLTGVNIGSLIKTLARNDRLEGRGNVQGELSTQGGNPDQALRNLNGRLAAQLQDGALKGINIGATLRQAKATMAQLQGQQVKQASASEKTDFTELSASFNIRNGVAHNEDLNAKSPLLRLAGNGDINLPDKTLDYLLKASVVGTAVGQSGRELEQLKGVTVPVRVKGSLLAPSYALDFNNLVADTARAKLNEQLDRQKQDLQKKAGDALTDQLQKLFKK